MAGAAAVVLIQLSLSAPALSQAAPVHPGLEGSPQAVTESLRPQMRRVMALPKARWGKARRSWTRAMVIALRSHANPLPRIVPRDIGTWCPAYPTADIAQREAFWVGLVSSLAWHESTHRPTAVGGGNQWFGLVQIFPPTARHYGCRARSGAALKNPEDNLSCGLRIMAETVPRDGVISAGMRGVAADWGPFHSERKRADMIAWTRSQDYCRQIGRSLRPVSRPAALELSHMPRPHSRPEGLVPRDVTDALPPEALAREDPGQGDAVMPLAAAVAEFTDLAEAALRRAEEDEAPEEEGPESDEAGDDGAEGDDPEAATGTPAPDATGEVADPAADAT